MLTKLLLGKSTKLWDLYLDQALFSCRVRTHSTTKTSPFYLVYGKHPRILGDHNAALSAEAVTADHQARIQAVYSARQEASRATFERALQAKTIRDELVKEHELNEGEWVLVRHENPQKFETKWFGPYQIAERMALGTYRLQDPTGKELQALVHGNRLLRAYINSAEELRKLWASPSGKDALRRENRKAAEYVNSDKEGTELLERLLLDDNLEPIISETDVTESIPLAETIKRPAPSSIKQPVPPKRRKNSPAKPRPSTQQSRPPQNLGTRRSERQRQPNSRYT
jgi:hypothetical protein